MNINTYNKLLNIVEPLITKMDTNMRENISPNAKLVHTLEVPCNWAII